MLAAAEVYAAANQATIITPFILAGAMAPVTIGRGRRPDARRGAGRHGVRAAGAAGRAGRVRVVRHLDVDADRRADVRHARAVARALRRRPAGPPPRRAVPIGRLRSCASKLPDAQAAYESANTLQATVLGGVNFVLHAAGWLEGGLADRLREVRPRRRPARDDGDVRAGRRPVARTARRSTRSATNGPGKHFLGTAHTLANFENAFYRSTTADNASYEQWLEDGGARRRAAGQQDLEGAARRLRAAADRRRRSTRSCASSSRAASPRCRTPSPDPIVLSFGHGPIGPWPNDRTVSAARFGTRREAAAELGQLAAERLTTRLSIVDAGRPARGRVVRWPASDDVADVAAGDLDRPRAAAGRRVGVVELRTPGQVTLPEPLPGRPRRAAGSAMMKWIRRAKAGSRLPRRFVARTAMPSESLDAAAAGRQSRWLA